MASQLQWRLVTGTTPHNSNADHPTNGRRTLCDAVGTAAHGRNTAVAPRLVDDPLDGVLPSASGYANTGNQAGTSVTKQSSNEVASPHHRVAGVKTGVPLNTPLPSHFG